MSKKSGYMGNKHLPTVDAKFEYTPEQFDEMEKCKASMLYFAENYFYIIDPDNGKVNINLYDVQKKILDEIDDHRYNILLCPRQSGKCYELTTLVPTPYGDKTIGELVDGDMVYGSDGKPCEVLRVWETKYNLECYEIEFDCGEVILVDYEHKWFAQTKTHRERLRTWMRSDKVITDEMMKEVKGDTFTTGEMYENFLQNNGEPYYRIPLCVNGVDGVYDDSLPIDPYTLGLWLGDGDSAGFSITVDNIYLNEQMGRLQELNPHLEVYEGTTSENKAGSIILSSKHDENLIPRRTLLKKCDLYKNKHIPEKYLLASREQRLELLKGIIDSDGEVTSRGECIFSNMNEVLAKQVKRLIASLGYKPTFRQKMAKLDGRECGMCSYVSFHPREDVCYLEYKRERIKHEDITEPNPSKRSQWHYIKDIRKVDSVPVKCITVDREDELFLLSESYILGRNTTLMTIAALHEACFFDHKSIVIAANKESTAAEIFKRVRLAYEELPNWLKPATAEYAKTSATFGNGSSIGITATTTNAIRGRTLNMLIMDELAFIESVSHDTMTKIRNKKTGKIEEIPIGEFYSRFN